MKPKYYLLEVIKHILLGFGEFDGITKVMKFRKNDQSVYICYSIVIHKRDIKK